MNTLELDIIRNFFHEQYTIGWFYADGVRWCNTMEDVVRTLIDKNNDGDFTDEGEGKIYGQTAIPYGRYKVIVTDSPKLGRRLPLLLNVPGFTGIRIHFGKNAKWSEGCPLVGENNKRGELENPDWINKIIKIIDQATKEGKETWITIKQG
jgi:hypothetical protein